MNHCVLSAAGADNDNADSNNILLLSMTQMYLSLQSQYQEKKIKNYQNFLTKSLKDQCIGMNV